MKGEKNFIIVPEKIITSKVLKSTEKVVLIALIKFYSIQKKCYPSVKTLAKYLNISERQIIRTLKLLEAKGFITKKRENKNNLYTLKFLEIKNIFDDLRKKLTE